VPYNDSSEIEGTVVQYYREGNVQITYFQKDGKKNGKAVWFYENGEKYLEVNYIEDEFDGDLVKYYDNGKIQSVTPYDKGELLPGTIEYNQLGEKMDSIELIIDVKNSLSVNNKYQLIFSLSENVKNVVFFNYVDEGEGTITKYKFVTENKIGSHTITILPGAFYKNNYKIVAIVETLLDNRFMIIKHYTLNITNNRYKL
ncbi:MAG: hypothetical protein JXR68_07165, partial [Bacteroidales bacterium]|nr:hypothetical protein [Bacteroidales bacterium]